MSSAWATAALLWMLTIGYAVVESGVKLIGHCRLTTFDALLGRGPSCAQGAVMPGSTTTATSFAGKGEAGVATGIVAYARSHLGIPYAYAGPTNGSCDAPDNFDCSGLTRCAVLAGSGGSLDLPHSSAMQLAYLSAYRVPANLASLRAGDLIFYFSPIHHVAIYIGGGQMIAAPHTGDVVRIEPWNADPVVGAARPAAMAAKRGGGGGGRGGTRTSPSPSPLRSRAA